MEKLLNVRQAAELLNVSEMTVRRWTNAGLLACFRIGKKRERRFYSSDIQQFIEVKNIPPPPRNREKGLQHPCPPCGFGIWGLGCAGRYPYGPPVYADVAEVLGVQAMFLRQGVENRETVMVISPQHRREQLLSAMEQECLDVTKLIRENRLIHGSGKQTPLEMAEYISNAAASVLGRFRLIGDMSWTRHKKWSEENLRFLEDTTNTRLSPGNLFLCQYSLKDFCGTQTMMALETHACAFYKGKFKKNLLQMDG